MIFALRIRLLRQPALNAQLQRWALLWMVVFSGLGAFGAIQTTNDPVLHSISKTYDGKEYIPLEALAKSFQLKLSWKPGDDHLWLSNQWLRARFFIDSHRCELDGIVVSMSHAVIARGGVPLLSRQDYSSLFRPLLVPAKNRPKKQIRTVALDPGHGGKDPGNQDGARKEKDFTLKLAQELKERLQQCGLKVVLTRADDMFVPLEDRPTRAKQRGADAMLSLHFNAISRPNSQIRGSVVYCLTPEGSESTEGNSDGIPPVHYPGNRQDQFNVLLAYNIQKAIVRNLDSDDLGVRRARWVVLRNAEMPAVLIEGGFMSDPQDAHRIYSDHYRKQLAQAIIDGFLAYKRLVER
jgi:N-acetylmuramoyl-L-alanine amidase